MFLLLTPWTLSHPSYVHTAHYSTLSPLTMPLTPSNTPLAIPSPLWHPHPHPQLYPLPHELPDFLMAPQSHHFPNQSHRIWTYSLFPDFSYWPHHHPGPVLKISTPLTAVAYRAHHLPRFIFCAQIVSPWGHAACLPHPFFLLLSTRYQRMQQEHNKYF